MNEGELIEGIEGVGVQDLPLKYQLNIKRSVCRIEVIKWDSDYDMRYELFNRLNTGGSTLTDQEIRNCIFRGISPEFTEMIKDLASDDDFVTLISPTKKQKLELMLDELVLRFFSLLDNKQNVKKKLSEHLTEYMRDATTNRALYEDKVPIFKKVVEIMRGVGRDAFLAKNGQFSTSLYDGIMIGLGTHLEHYSKQNLVVVQRKVEELKSDAEFKQASGVASNHRTRVKKRIERALEIFGEY